MTVQSLVQDTRERGGQFLVFTALFVAALIIGGLIGSGMLIAKSLIVLLAGFLVLPLGFLGANSTLRAAYLLAIAAFAVGHRSVYVGQFTYFVPAELITWILFFSLLARFLVERKGIPRLPGVLIFFVVWSLLSLLLTPDILQQWDNVFPDSKTWVAGLPVFFVTLALITDIGHLRAILRILIIVALYMSIMALVENKVPGIASRVPWFFNSNYVSVDTIEGFSRDYFGFWGNPIGVVIIGWGVLGAFDELLHGRDTLWRVLAVMTCLAGFGATYVSGQRETWFALPIGLALLGLLSGNRGFVLLVPFAALSFFLSADFWVRLQSVLPGSSYFTYDTSIQERFALARQAIDRILANPIFGVGWGRGLVHNEFLGFGSHLGLPAMIAFVLLLVQILRRLVDTYLQTSSAEFRRFSRLFLVLFVTWLLDLNFHPVLSVATVAIPFWVMLSLAWVLPNLSDGSSAPKLDTAQKQLAAVARAESG